MNASLPIVQISPDSTGAASGMSANLSSNQGDSALSSAFGPLLDQASSALEGAVPADPAALEAEAELMLQLQSLPQGGKLLPLLEQALDQATAAGADRQQAVEAIAAQLESLLETETGDPVAAMAATLTGMLETRPAATAQTLEPALAQAGAVRAQAGNPETATARQHPAGVQAAALAADADAADEAKSSAFDRVLLQPVSTTQSEPRHSELSQLVAAFKRQLDNPGRPADTLPRAEASTVALSAPSTVAVASAPAAAQPHQLSLSTPLNQAGWDQALGERIQWLASQSVQSARITLNPANLGPMEVRIQVHNDQASVQFAATHGVVREALEAALPRLRDMFEASGVELVDVDVAGQSFAEQQRSAGEEGVAARSGGGQLPEPAEETPGLVAETALASFLPAGRLDLFA